jgi:glyoxylase-like metal-dependent hydrolase (beta-lactamase superfamily II)
LLWIVAVVAVLIVAGVVYVMRVTTDLEVDRVTDDLHMVRGLGGYVGVLATGEGTVLVDTMTFAHQGEALRELAERLTGEPVVMVINTHYHLDHTHGNPAIEPGTRVIATGRTLEYLRAIDGDYWRGDAAHGLPNETFEHEHVVQVGRKTIRLSHPGRGHTDGDLVAYFVEDDAVHLGDLYFNRHYPNIDLAAGGSVMAWSATLDEVFALPASRVLPGHGPLSDKDGLRDFQAFIEELAEVGRAAAREGLTLEQTLASARLSTDEGYSSPLDIPFVGGLDRDFVITRAWEEATGATPSPFP